MKNEIDNMKTVRTQLELPFAPAAKLPTAPPPSRPLRGARWWFRQLHALVDLAFDWSTAPTPPPQQIHLTLAKAR